LETAFEFPEMANRVFALIVLINTQDISDH